MPKKPTTDQMIIMDRLHRGEPVDAKEYATWDGEPHIILSFGSHVEPDGCVVCHRAFERVDLPGHHLYEIYRIHPSGHPERI